MTGECNANQTKGEGILHLHIELIDTLHDRRLQVNLPDDMPLEQLVPPVARKLGLLRGQYIIMGDETGVRLSRSTTLLERGVRGSPAVGGVASPTLFAHQLCTAPGQIAQLAL
jgi:hypothetical protein